MRHRARGSGEGPTTAESARSTFDELLTSAPDDTHRALGYLTQWAEDNGLASYDKTTSRVFALPPRRGVIWFFVPTPRSTRELELDLKKLRALDSRAARDVLAKLDELGLSPSTDYPRIPHRALVRRWEAVRDQVLEPYLAACRAA